MKLSRSSRLLTVLLTLFCVLFMQLADAAYACPNRILDESASVSDTAETPMMLNCAGMDSDQPALCHIHAHDPFSQQSLDKSPQPDIQPFITNGLIRTLNLNEIIVFTHWLQPAASLHRRTTAPPIAIRHCCFRI